MSDPTHDPSDDALRARLSRIDPALAGPPVDTASSPRAEQILERIMSTSTDVPTPTTTSPGGPARWRRTGLAVAAAVAAAAVGLGVGFAGGSDGPADKPDAPTTLALSLPPSGVMASCLMFDVQVLRGMSPAFAGTVTSVDGGTVTLDVDRWYRGGTADQVTLRQPDDQSSAALDGVAFEQGKRYLVTAADGVVNGCGFSGPATPALEKSFDEAFGG